MLIAAPTILGVLDKARKNTFKNQVLLYVEALKQQTSLAMMGGSRSYSELQTVDTAFYAPTSDSAKKIVRVNVSNLNRVMDNQILVSDTDKYFYVEWTNNGYNYYIGQGVRKDGEYQTSCSGVSNCTNITYNSEEVQVINSKNYSTDNIIRNDVSASNSSSSNSGSGSNPSTPTADTTAPQVGTVALSGDNKKTLTISATDNVGVTGYCVTTTNDSSTCSSWEEATQTVTDYNLYYVFARDAANNISTSKKVAVLGNNGNQVSLGNYNWHVIGQTNNNDGNDKVYLLMDFGQLNNNAHCRDTLDETNNCTFNGDYFVYSWDNSLIREYLNNAFYTTLTANDSRISDFIKKTQICKDSSIISDDSYSYGGYTKEEIELISDATCGNDSDIDYTLDNVRLITPSEYHNLSPYYDEITYPTITSSRFSNGEGTIPNIGYITRIDDSSWLYPSITGIWWTTGVLSTTRSSYTGYGIYVSADGEMLSDASENTKVIRPVIVLTKN